MYKLRKCNLGSNLKSKIPNDNLKKFETKLGAVAVSMVIVTTMLTTGCKDINRPIVQEYIIEYLVEEGDTLTSIANNYNISVQDIIHANTIDDPNNIKVGQTLNLPQKLEYINISVTDGDTLTAIAQNNETSVELISLLNNIENPDKIEIGQVLFVPRGIKKLPEDSLTFFNQIYDYIGILNNKVNGIFSTSSSIDLYDWDKKLEHKGYVKGIDISDFQARESSFDLDYILKNNDIDFVIIRSYVFLADREIDPKFDEYCQIAQDNGVALGTYFWPTLKNTETTKEEVDILINSLKANEEKGIHYTMPIFIDIETRENGGGLVADRLRDNDPDTVKSFEFLIEYIRNQGYEVMLYVNHDVAINYKLKALADRLNLKIWVAGGNYYKSEISFDEEPTRYANELSGLSGPGRQYCDHGKVEGYDKNIDLDLWYENTPRELLENGYNNLGSFRQLRNKNFKS